MSGKNFPKRGEIYWVNFNPAKGSETKKRRPALVISNDVGNEISDTVIVAPLTSKAARVYPFEVKVVVSQKIAKIMLNQCRAIDKSRLQKKIEEVDFETLHAVEEAIKVVFSLN